MFDPKQLIARKSTTIIAAWLLGLLSLKTLKALFPALNPRFARWKYILKSVVSYYVPRPSTFLLRLGVHLAPSFTNPVVDHHWLHSVLQSHIQSGKGWTRDDGVLPSSLPAILSVDIPNDAVGWGLVSSVFKVKPNWSVHDENLPGSFVLKRGPLRIQEFKRLAGTVSLGTPREAIFYNWINENKYEDVFRDIVPQIFYAYGNQFSGDYTILMQDLNRNGKCIPASALLGNQCWGPVTLPPGLDQDPAFVLETVFRKAADFHAKFWRDRSLLSNSWMKSVKWIQGRDRDSWEMAIAGMRNSWEVCLREGKIKSFSPAVMRQIESAFENTSWKNFKKNFDIEDPATPFTLCHGDFHAANVLWGGGKGSHPFFMVDWSEVGVFCPFTDLAQFIISNATIQLRRQEEVRVFKIYYDQLISRGINPEVFPLEACWKRYRKGGIEKWIQMLLLMTARDMIPEHAVVWFHDQLKSFIDDHSENGTLQVSLMTGYCLH